MRSKLAAMTWEMLRRGWWQLLVAALGANLMPLVILTALSRDGGLEPGSPSVLIMHVVLLQMNMFIFGAGVLSAQGQPSRLYTYPIPTSFIVIGHLLPAMILMVGETAASIAAFNALYHLDWPVWGPALYSAVAFASVTAVLWTCEKSGWLVVMLAGVGTVLGLWYKSRFGPLNAQPTHSWPGMTPLEFFTLLGFGIVAVVAAVPGVARNRCGDPLPAIGILAWITRVLDFGPELGLAFRTPMEALYWCEWRKKGWTMPASVVCLAVVLGTGWLIFSRNLQSLLDGTLAGGGMLLAIAFIGGIILGNVGIDDAHYEMSQFNATRPLTSTQFSTTLLSIGARSVLLSWLIWLVGLGAVCLLWLAIVGSLPDWPRELRWWYLLAPLPGCWIVSMTFAVAGLLGRTKSVMIGMSGLISLYMASMLLSKFALSPESQMNLGRGVLAALGVGFPLLTIWAFAAARRRALIGSATLYAAAGAWCFVTAGIAVLAVLYPTPWRAEYLFLSGLAALALAPLSTAPLAIAWNRVR